MVSLSTQGFPERKPQVGGLKSGSFHFSFPTSRTDRKSCLQFARSVNTRKAFTWQRSRPEKCRLGPSEVFCSYGGWTSHFGFGSPFGFPLKPTKGYPQKQTHPKSLFSPFGGLDWFGEPLVLVEGLSKLIFRLVFKIRFPPYWNHHDGEFNELVPMTGERFEPFKPRSTLPVSPRGHGIIGESPGFCGGKNSEPARMIGTFTFQLGVAQY